MMRCLTNCIDCRRKYPDEVQVLYLAPNGDFGVCTDCYEARTGVKPKTREFLEAEAADRAQGRK